MDRRIKALALILIILLGFGLAERAEARTEITLDVFYDALTPYGEWIEHDYYGYIWRPAPVGPYWKPYNDGNWQYSDEGWIWVSNEPWGWATYHYGRWVPDDYYGWVWIPGVTWAPSYVEWYDSPGYIGWAPRPPDKSFFLEIGIGGGSYGYYQPGLAFNFSYYKPYKPYKHYRKKHKYYHKHYHKHHHYYNPEHHVYVPYNDFGRKNPKFVSVENHNTVVYKNSTNITNVTYVNNKKVYKGPDRRYVEKRAGRKIKSVDIRERDKVVYRGGRDLNRVKSGEYEVYRPKVVKRGYEKPKNITRRYDRKGDYKSGYKKSSIKRGLNASDNHSLVNIKGYGYKKDSSSNDGYQKRTNRKSEYGYKAKSTESKLAPAKNHKKKTNRNNFSRSYQNSKPSVYEKQNLKNSGVNRDRAKYETKPRKRKLGKNSSKNSVSLRKDNFKAQKSQNTNFNSRKPFKAENKSIAHKKNQRGQAAFKSNKSQNRHKSFNKKRQQKSFKPSKGYKANKSVKEQNRNYGAKANSYQKSNNKKASKNNLLKGVSRNQLYRNTDRSRNSYKNLSQRSFKRQVKR